MDPLRKLGPFRYVAWFALGTAVTLGVFYFLVPKGPKTIAPGQGWDASACLPGWNVLFCLGAEDGQPLLETMDKVLQYARNSLRPEEVVPFRQGSSLPESWLGWLKSENLERLEPIKVLIDSAHQGVTLTGFGPRRRRTQDFALGVFACCGADASAVYERLGASLPGSHKEKAVLMRDAEGDGPFLVISTPAGTSPIIMAALVGETIVSVISTEDRGDILADIIARFQRPERKGSLREDKEFKAVAEQAAVGRDNWVFVNLSGVLKVFPLLQGSLSNPALRNLPISPSSSPMEQVMEMLGLKGLGAVGGTLKTGEPLQGDLFLHWNEPKGVLGLLKPLLDSKRDNLLGWLPVDSRQVLRCRMDLSILWDSTQGLLDMVGRRGSFEWLDRIQSQGKLEIGKDLFAPLGDEIACTWGPRWGVVIRLKDAAAFVSGLDRFLRGAGFHVSRKSELFEGRTLYSVTPLNVMIAYAVCEDLLVVAQDMDMLKAMVSGAGAKQSFLSRLESSVMRELPVKSLAENQIFLYSDEDIPGVSWAIAGQPQEGGVKIRWWVIGDR